MTETYCPLAWVGLNILPRSITPCCLWEGPNLVKDADTITDALASPEFEDVRKRMLAGERIKNCEQCYGVEKVGNKSRRQQSIEQFGIVTEPSFKMLDISFDNVCNLKCRSCLSVTSHQWHNDEVALYGKALSDKKLLEHGIDVDCSQLEQINISGGEPMLSKKCELFLGKLILEDVIQNVRLGIVTNCTITPSKTILDAMFAAKELYLTISIDGIGKLNDYFRSGSDFDTCVKNMELFTALYERANPTTIIVNTTVNIYNVNMLKEIETFFAERFPKFELQHRMLYWPEQLCIENMPADLKAQVRPIVESYGPDYADVLAALDVQGVDRYGHFLMYHHKLDELRNETFDCNSLLANYIQEHNTPSNTTEFLLQQVNKWDFYK